ncbi:MAG: CRP-like cAMP-binding protein [Cognaticolwellia sp.]|jgi:CRP-like cAMP-binding protein
MDLPAFLGEHPLFKSLDEQALAHLLAHCQVLDFGPAHAIAREGSAADSCFVLLDGQARATRTRPNGAQDELARVAPGGVFGLVGFVGKGQRPCTYGALGPCSVLCIQASVLDVPARTPQAKQVLALRELLALGLQSQLRVANEHLVNRAAAVRAPERGLSEWEAMTHGGWKAPADPGEAD